MTGNGRPGRPSVYGSGVRLSFFLIAVSPFAHEVSRRTLAAFSAFSVGTAAGHNIQTILISRFFAGFFSSGMQTLGPSTLSSLFSPKELAVPFSVAAISPFLGPSDGPLVGGYVTQYSGSWRNINWVSVGFAGVMSLASCFVSFIYFVGKGNKAPLRLRDRFRNCMDRRC